MAILYLGNKLSKHGFSVTSVETLGPLLESVGFELYYASDKKNQVVRMGDMLYSIFKYRNRVDKVLIDTYSRYGFWYVYASSIVCKMLRLPYYPILRGGNLPDRIRRYPKCSRFIFMNSKVNVAPSGYLKKVFEDAGFNVVYIPNNIDLKQYRFKERQSFGPKLLWVRSFAFVYNPQMAVELVKNMKGEFPDIKLSMVGPDKDGTMEECRQLVKEYGLEKHINFTGKMEKKAWHDYSEEFDIFINTTNIDNTPISVIEAMALGLPVVSTNVGGVGYLINDNEDGLLVGKGDVLAMEQSIKQVMADSGASSRELAKNARHKVGEFDWEVVKHKWEELLQ